MTTETLRKEYRITEESPQPYAIGRDTFHKRVTYEVRIGPEPGPMPEPDWKRSV